MASELELMEPTKYISRVQKCKCPVGGELFSYKMIFQDRPETGFSGQLEDGRLLRCCRKHGGSAIVLAFKAKQNLTNSGGLNGLSKPNDLPL